MASRVTTIEYLCQQAISLVRGKRLILNASELTELNELDYEALGRIHAQDEAVVCAMNFERVRDRLLQLYPWTFARRHKSFSTFDRTMPDECLTVLCVLNQAGEPIEYNTMTLDYDIPDEAATLIYTYRVEDIKQWPPIFCDVFAYSLAVEICTAVTGKPEYIQPLEQKVQELIIRAHQIGAIKAETRLTLKEELYNRAIGLSRGQRSVKETSTASIQQGLDTSGFVNDRMTAEYQACVRAADRVRDRLLGLYAWRFARKYATLTQTASTIYGWKYAHKLPDDCIRVLSAQSHSLPFDGAPEDFEEAGNVVYSNILLPEIRYTSRIEDMDRWPGVFADVFCYSLAEEIVMSTTGNAETIQLLNAKATKIIEEAQALGEIKPDVNIPAGEELYNRAIALVRGHRGLSTTRTTAAGAIVSTEQDITGDVNYREREAIAVCRRSMPELRDKLLRLYAWRFARSSTSIFPMPSHRQAGWDYAYTKGGGCMKVLAVFSGDEPVEYEETDEFILSNASEDMTMRYTKSVEDIAHFDPIFKEVLCYELAQEIAAALMWNTEAITLLSQKEQLLIQDAYRTGAIQEETRIPLKEEIYNRAIGLTRGVRSLKPTSDVTGKQGMDNFSYANDRTDAEIRACRRCSESARDKLLQMYPWTFARKNTDLTSTGTISGWSNGYTLPLDCMQTLTILVNNEPVDYEVIGGNVYCNGAGASIRYTSKVEDMTQWPAGFVNVFCYELAEEIISATTGSNEEIALLEQKKQALIVEGYKIGTIKTETRIPAKLELFNRAIGLVKGLKTVNPDMKDVRYEDELSACRRGHDSIRDRLLQSYAWVFCRKTETPAQMSESVPGWKYTYLLPEDCLKVIAVIGRDRRADWNNEYTCRNVSDYPDVVELMEYETAGQELYANRDVVYVRYTARIEDSTQCGAIFTEAFVILLAIEVALNVVGDKNIIAILEQRLARLIEDARMNGVIREETGLPKQRESQRVGGINRQYLDYSGFPTLPCDYYGRRPCYEGGTGELCGWRN